MAYLGYLKGYGFIYEVAEDEKIDAILRRALNESASALAARHGVPESELADFVEHLIPRLYNPLLEDSIFRVGRDTRRKLSAGDRLGGAYIAVREQGKTPAAIGLSIAAALRFDMPEDEIGVEVSTFAKENGVAAALEKYCSITADEDVALIKGYYDMLATPDWDALIAKIDENKNA
jgi:mannitol-1-phosphate 5-dehydrogenase